MALNTTRVAEDLGADVTLLLARRKMDQLTAHARHYVFPLWISLLRMRDIIFFAMMDHITAHGRHYVLLTMDQLTAHAQL
jgi:hypothetical protein